MAVGGAGPKDLCSNHNFGVLAGVGRTKPVRLMMMIRTEVTRWVLVSVTVARVEMWSLLSSTRRAWSIAGEGPAPRVCTRPRELAHI